MRKVRKMDWRQQLAAAAAPEGAAEETTPVEEVVEVVVGGKTINVPAPIKAGDIVAAVGSTPADTYYIIVSAEGRKLPADEDLPAGARVFLVPVRVDG